MASTGDQMSRGRGPRAGRSGAESGMTVIEIAIAMSLFGLTTLGVLGVMGYSTRLNAVNRETAAATQAARAVIEEMRARTGRNAILDFNVDADDDPAGAGTGPGNSFIVDELGTEGGGIGTILMPLVSGELREDIANEALGMPRDLNCDDTVDGLDHKDDYELLPVIVRVEWTGVSGERTLEFHTLLKPED